MPVVADREGGNLMYQVLREIKQGGKCPDKLLDAALDTDGYRFYLRFHRRMPEPFGPDEFRAMVRSLARCAGGPAEETGNRRLAGVRDRFLDGMRRLEEIGGCVGILDALPQAHWDQMESAALSVLPAGTVLNTRIHYIMDGFNNGTAFEGEVSFDLLQTTPRSIREFELALGAHELHHIGYSNRRAADQWRTVVQGNARSPLGCTLSIIDTVVSEGIAQYYFTGAGFEEYLREVAAPDVAAKLVLAYKAMLENRSAKAGELFASLERLLSIAGPIEPAYNRKVRLAWAHSEPGNPVPWAHVLGSLMIGLIDRCLGRTRVIELVDRPEQLLAAYSDALKACPGHPGAAAVALPAGELPHPSADLMARLAAARS